VTSAELDSPGAAAENTVGADGVIVTTSPLPRNIIEALDQSVLIIGRAGVGLDAIDLQAQEIEVSQSFTRRSIVFPRWRHIL
jgi:D-3-phosphoglycerate dehydrogenase